MCRKKKIKDVSVIIPTLNRCNFLKKALESVFKQTIQPKEIIVIDNGSSDNTKEMVCSLFPTVKFVKEIRRGVSAARNKGIKLAKSEWLAFLDSDDLWKAKKLEKQLLFACQNKDKFRFIHTNEIWYRNGKLLNQMKKHEKSGGNIFMKSLDFCCVSPSSSLLKKKIFNDHGFFDESLEVCEDYDMWIRISSKEEIGYLSEPMVLKFGGHVDQLSKKHWGMDRFRIKSLEKNLINNLFSQEQNKVVYKKLIKKLTIVSNGASKRGNIEVFKKYRDKLDYWLTKSDKFKYEI